MQEKLLSLKDFKRFVRDKYIYAAGDINYFYILGTLVKEIRSCYDDNYQYLRFKDK